MKKKKIIFTVTNDLAFDQRMQRICSTLASDFEVELVGRVINNSKLVNRNFKQTRFSCFFNKGKLFYIEFNLRLLFYLLFSKLDIICAIDLDTLVPCYLSSKLRRKPLVYDAHEYYTEVIELANRPFEKKIWLMVEKNIVPRLKYAYTVSASLQQLFTQKYAVPFELIRNVTLLKPKQAKLSPDKYLIYVGAVNAGRGVSELLHAMRDINIPLHICGIGDVLEEMKQLALDLGVNQKVIFHGNVPPEQLSTHISNAFAGFLLLENKGLSYYYSLANKFFDYLHGEIPQITINFPEYQFINKQYEVALLIDLKPTHIVMAVNKLLEDNELYNSLVENCKLAKNEYCWQSESQRLLNFYHQIK